MLKIVGLAFLLQKDSLIRNETLQPNYSKSDRRQMSPRVLAISAAGFCNTCSFVRQRKPQGWRHTSSGQIPSQNGKRWERASPAEAGEGRPGISVPEQLSSTLAFFQRLNPSLLQQLVSPFVTFFLPFCFPGSGGRMVQGRLLGGRPLKLGAAVPLSPPVLQQTPPVQVWCSPAPSLPEAEKMPTLGETGAVRCDLRQRSL